MAVYVKRSGAWVPSDGEAISLENSSTYTCPSIYAGWNPGLEGSFAGGGWLNGGWIGESNGYTGPWTKASGAADARSATPGLFAMPKAGIWMISASIQWEATVLAPFYLRAETFGAVVAQASAVAYPRTTSGLATVNLEFVWSFLQDQALGFRACTSSGASPPGATMSNAKVRLHWLSHSYAS